MQDRDDDLDYLITEAKRDTNASTVYIVVMLSLICKAVRDLQRRNAT
jgi:hypothetical protein